MRKTKKFKQERVRDELKLMILKTIYNFKSLEEPSYKELTNEDIIHVLSSIITRKTE